MKTIQAVYKITLTDTTSKIFTPRELKRDYCEKLRNNLVKERIDGLHCLPNFPQSIQLGIYGLSVDKITNVDIYEDCIYTGVSTDECHMHITWTVDDSVTSLDKINEFLISTVWIWSYISKIEVVN